MIRLKRLPLKPEEIDLRLDMSQQRFVVFPTGPCGRADAASTPSCCVWGVCDGRSGGERGMCPCLCLLRAAGRSSRSRQLLSEFLAPNYLPSTAPLRKCPVINFSNGAMMLHSRGSVIIPT